MPSIIDRIKKINKQLETAKTEADEPYIKSKPKAVGLPEPKPTSSEKESEEAIKRAKAKGWIK